MPFVEVTTQQGHEEAEAIEQREKLQEDTPLWQWNQTRKSRSLADYHPGLLAPDAAVF